MSIRNKITYGYLGTLSVAITGISLGLIMGNQYKQAAEYTRRLAAQETDLLSRLQLAVLYNRPAKQLSPYLQDPEGFQRESNSLLSRLKAIQDLLAAHKQSNQDLTLPGLEPFLNSYEGIVNDFITRVMEFINTVQPLTESTSGAEAAQQQIVALVKSPEFVAFIEAPDQMLKLYQQAAQQEADTELALVEAQRLSTKIILGSLGLSLLIAIILSLYISRVLTRPIQVVTDIAQAVTREANFDLRAPIPQEAEQDEIAYLALSLNQLIEQVQYLMAEQHAHTENLEKAKEASDVANQAKSKFLASMSHELRTPLNGILGYAQILSRSEYLKEKERHGLKVIYQCGSHLLALINDILDLSKIEAKKLVLEFKELHFPSFMQNIAEMCLVRAETKGIELISEIDPDIPMGLLIDEKHLRQVLVNLISNAIKFTERGSVTIRVTRLAPSTPSSLLILDSTPIQLRFAIQDTGVGIAEGDLERIFQAFEQVGDRRRQAEGTGLGLAISQQIVVQMGGKIQVQSQVGIGSTFSFDLSLMSCQNWVEGEARYHGQEIIGYEGKPRHLLLVDDRWENRSVLTDLLTPLGFQITEAENGQDALLKAQNYPFDLIITDIRMPVMDGFQFLKQLRQDPKLKDIKIIASSASVADADCQNSLIVGANDFLPKPIEAENLFTLLASYMEITWKFRPVEKGSEPQLDPQDLVPPSPKELQHLFELAQDGLLWDLATVAEEIGQKDPRYLPFTQRLSQMAKQFQTEQIEAFIQKHLHLQQV